MVNQLEKLEYHLSHDINPEVDGAVGLTILGVKGLVITFFLY